MNYSILRPVDYMCYEKFTWQVPFNLLEQPDFSWRTRIHGDRFKAVRREALFSVQSVKTLCVLRVSVVNFLARCTRISLVRY